jgi:periplasmic protein TonB
MKRRLFEDLVVSVSGKRPRGRLALPVSVTLHAAGVAALLALPAFTTEALPDPPPSLQPPMVATVHIAQPPPPQRIDAGPRPAVSRPRRTASVAAARPVASVSLPTGDTPVSSDDDVEIPPDTPICFNCDGPPVVGNPALPPGDDGGGTGTGTATGPLRVGGQIRPPTKVRDVRPAYPDLAKAARVQGPVTVECTISPDGRVENVRPVAGHPLLQGAALEAVSQWRYTPTFLNGVAVPVIMTVTVHFILH